VSATFEETAETNAGRFLSPTLLQEYVYPSVRIEEKRELKIRLFFFNASRNEQQCGCHQGDSGDGCKIF
jgi:hypothetical protein